MLDMPYFMENENWYDFDVEKGRYILTDAAPERARTSYAEYYDALDNIDE